MTPEDLAELHARAFAPARGWSVSEFATLCSAKHTRLFTQEGGFALVQVVATEAELLTLAVDPDHRCMGIADALMQDVKGTIEADTIYLEVASDNLAALALYAKHGFEVSGHRNGYYRRKDAVPVDAVLMQLALTCGRGGRSRG